MVRGDVTDKSKYYICAENEMDCICICRKGERGGVVWVTSGLRAEKERKSGGEISTNKHTIGGTLLKHTALQKRK